MNNINIGAPANLPVNIIDGLDFSIGATGNGGNLKLGAAYDNDWFGANWSKESLGDPNRIMDNTINREIFGGNIKFPETGLEAFMSTAKVNTPFKTFREHPVYGLKYVTDNFNFDFTGQKVPVDLNKHGFNAPAEENMYKFNLNIPFSL